MINLDIIDINYLLVLSSFHTNFSFLYMTEEGQQFELNDRSSCFKTIYIDFSCEMSKMKVCDVIIM